MWEPGKRDQRPSATRLGEISTATCHPLGPPEVAGPLQQCRDASMCCRRFPSLTLRASMRFGLVLAAPSTSNVQPRKTTGRSHGASGRLFCAGPCGAKTPLLPNRLGYKVPIDQADGAGGGSGAGSAEPLPSSIIVPCGWQHPDEVPQPDGAQQLDRRACREPQRLPQRLARQRRSRVTGSQQVVSTTTGSQQATGSQQVTGLQHRPRRCLASAVMAVPRTTNMAATLTITKRLIQSPLVKKRLFRF